MLDILLNGLKSRVGDFNPGLSRNFKTPVISCLFILHFISNPTASYNFH